MAVTVLPEGRPAATGAEMQKQPVVVVVPLPSWPWPLKPQAQAEPGDPVVPAAWVSIGEAETIVPNSASMAATPSTARALRPLRARHAGGAVVRVVTVSLPFLLHVVDRVVDRVDRSFCEVAPRTSSGRPCTGRRHLVD